MEEGLEITVRLLKDDLEPVEVQLSQVTPRSVSTLFSLDINTVFLRESGGPRAFFPDPTNRSFRFTGDVASTPRCFYVEGSVAEQFMETAGQSAVMSATSRANLSQTPGPSSYRPRSSFVDQGSRPIFTTKKGNSDSSFNLKIIQAKVSRGNNGKVLFESQGQLFTSINEATATVPYLSTFIHDKWGMGYVLVTHDGLRLEDSDGTRGLKFWKVPSRKIYAVLESQLSKGKSPIRRKVCINLDSEDSSDFDLPLKKKQKKIKASTDHVVEELKGLKTDIRSLFQITKFMKFPPGLYVLFTDTFKCSICLGIITPPVIFARCCKNILGCESCVDDLYNVENGSAKQCPLCRSERAFSDTCRINGLDDFLKGISPMFDEGETMMVPPPPRDESDEDFTFP